jgi:hypothetical protein
MEVVFFTGFSIMVLTQIAERTALPRGPSVAHAGPSG